VVKVPYPLNGNLGVVLHVFDCVISLKCVKELDYPGGRSRKYESPVVFREEGYS